MFVCLGWKSPVLAQQSLYFVSAQRSGLHLLSDTHTPDENQSTARPASSDVPTPVPFINVQLKAAGPRPDAGPTWLNSTPTKQTRWAREGGRDRERRAGRKEQRGRKPRRAKRELNMRRKILAQRKQNLVRRSLASAAVASVFGGQLGILDWRRLCDAHMLCPFSPGCQRHLLTLWMAALLPSGRAG